MLRSEEIESLLDDETKANYELLCDETVSNIEFIDHDRYIYTLRFDALESRWEISYETYDRYEPSIWVSTVEQWGHVARDSIQSITKIEEEDAP